MLYPKNGQGRYALNGFFVNSELFEFDFFRFAVLWFGAVFFAFDNIINGLCRRWRRSLFFFLFGRRFGRSFPKKKNCCVNEQKTKGKKQ